jgi:glucoamylase
MVSGTRMRFAGFAAAALLAGKASSQQVPLDDYIAEQRPIALQSVLDNIGPDGVEVPGTAAGLVVASPSKQDPDCTYLSPPCDTWQAADTVVP